MFVGQILTCSGRLDRRTTKNYGFVALRTGGIRRYLQFIAHRGTGWKQHDTCRNYEGPP